MSKIIPTDISDEMKDAYLDYAMSVIVARALPDVRDGLKPVHRRILYSAYQLNLWHNQSYKKSARLVGEVLGKYHPHGDAAIYDAIVRMAQDFSMRYVLIEGQGNFGSIDGDSAAAMRYTEVRLTKLAEEMLEDIDKNSVDFMPNFDNTLKEPIVLPAKVPNLLINGTSGIAVGMATNIPPHNLNEVIDGIIAYIKNPEISIEELMQYIKGPDFPTGAIIEGKKGIVDAYKTGRGKIILTSKYHFEEKGQKQIIVIDEIPYQTNKAEIIKEIAELAKKGIIDISDLRDESDRKHKIRIVIELRKESDRELILKRILTHTHLKTTYNIILLALVKGQPQLLNLKEMIHYFVEHRVDVIKRKTQYLLHKAKERLHIVNGLIIAISDIDKTVEILKNSKDVDDAKSRLISEFNIDEIQAKAILDMRLQRIIALEYEKLMNEKNNLEEEIRQYNEILASREKVLEIIIKELKELKEKYGDERKTEIVLQHEDISEEDLIKEEETIVVINDKNFIKRVSLDKIKIGTRNRQGHERLNDELKLIIESNTKDYLLLFSDRGKCYAIKTWRIVNESKINKGKHINHYVKLGNENITAGIAIKNFESAKYLVFVTKKGYIKKVELKEFENIPRSGLKGITLNNDEVVKVLSTNGNDEIFIYTQKGQIIRFDESEIRPMGRTARGVIGITLQNDSVIGAFKVDKEKLNNEVTVIAISREGKGKRSLISEFPKIKRGGKGVRNIKASHVAFSEIVMPEDEILFFSKKGHIKRLGVREIPVQGRNTSGVWLIRLRNDFIVGGIKIKLS